jgi:F-type H+-transporting ATPase subunit b
MEAKSTSLAMIEEAKNKSKLEGVKMIEAAKKSIEQERNAAISEMKSTVANLSIEIAEKLVKETLSSDSKQKQLADQLAEELNFN